MASTINADNGVVSGSSGVKTTADTSGVLALQSNGSTGVTLDTNLNVGIGVTPSNASGYTTLDLSNATSGGRFRLLVGSTPYGIFYTNGTTDVRLMSAAAVPLLLGTNYNEYLRIGTAGQIGLSGANYGTSGQVLTSGGSGAAPSWTTISGSSQWVTSGSDIYYNTGKVFIGATSSTSSNGTLQVQTPTSQTNAIDVRTNSGVAGNGGSMGMLGDGLYITANYYYASGQLKRVAANGATSFFMGAGTNDTDTYISFSTATTAQTQPTEKVRIDNAGRLLVGLTSANTSGANLQVSQGITFPATQSASSDANTLDDYEEGTWTPGILFGGNNVGIAYVNQVGKYTKIGNRVYVTCYVSTSNKGSSTGGVSINGLPFTSSGTSAAYNNVCVWADGLSSITGGLQGYNAPNSSTVSEISQLGTGAQSAITNSNCTTNPSFMINFSYPV